MTGNPKIVPFERSSYFVYRRAMKNQRENNLIDALELMRKAASDSPENSEYRLELAGLLGRTGCRGSSNRIYLDMLVNGESVGKCMYFLALNLLNSNDIEGAKRLLRMCEFSDESERAAELQKEIDIYESFNRPMNRKTERMMYISDLACDRMRAGDAQRARELFERVLKIDPNQCETRALMAMACAMDGDAESAKNNAVSVENIPDFSLRAACITAQVYSMLGDNESAKRLLRIACDLKADGLDHYLLLFSMYDEGMYAETVQKATEALKEEPYDRILLHVMALSSIKNGETQTNASHYWQRICRIDPDDTIAAYYAEAASNNALVMDGIGCEYQVPGREIAARFAYISEKMQGNYDSVAAQWREDKRFRALIGWCLVSNEQRTRETAISLIASFDDPEAESLLREYLIRRETGFDMTVRAAAIYRMRGRDIGAILPPFLRDSGRLVPDSGQVLEKMSVGHRQLVRLAGDVLKEKLGIYAHDQLAVLWELYRNNIPTKSDPMTKTETAAAALAYCYLDLAGGKLAIRQIADMFNCRVRQLTFYAEHLKSILAKGGASFETTDRF